MSISAVTIPWADVQVPEYRVFSLGKWRLRKTLPLVCHGYWSPYMKQPAGHVLEKRSAGKWRPWMSLTAMELQSHQPHIQGAQGNVIVGGLGMGMYLYNIIAKPEVERVLVLEKDPEVLALFERIVDWRKWPGAEKLTFAQHDIHTYKNSPRSPCDMLYVDIWERLGTDMAHLQTQNICENIRPGLVGYWGQEFDFMTFVVQNKLNSYALTSDDYQRFAAHLGLPLIEQQNPEYPKFAAAAVALQSALKEQARDPEIASKLVFASLRMLGLFASVPGEPEPAAVTGT